MKSLEDELKIFYFTVEKVQGGYLLNGYFYDLRGCHVNLKHLKCKRYSKNLKKFSNKKERTRLKENLKNDSDRSEIRDNKDNPWNWD